MYEMSVVAGPFAFRNARVVRTRRGEEVRARTPQSSHGRLVGIVNDQGQLVIMRGGEVLIIVEVYKA